MQIEIISFGKIADFIENQKMELDGISNTTELANHLERVFPLLGTIKYKIALNKQIVQGEVAIFNEDSVALMPPFSGG